jgi:ABC-type transport system substrate-binding protein
MLHYRLVHVLPKMVLQTMAILFLVSILTAFQTAESSKPELNPISNGLATFSYSSILKANEYQPTDGYTFVDYNGLPKVDEILFKAYPGAGPDAIVDDFLAGVTDWIEGPNRKDLYEQMVAAGEKVSLFDMAEFYFIAINCRDHKKTSGAVNFPLNDSAFRVALSYIYGVNDKQEDIYNYTQESWTYAIGNPVPPAQLPWYNESIQMPNTNWAYAWSLLQSAGYYVNVTDNWLYSGSTKLRNMTVWHSDGLFWPWGPGAGFVSNFNEFITAYLGAAGPTMTLVPVSFITLTTDLMATRDYDFICISLTSLGRYVDWLYDCLHSDNDVEWGFNFAGIHDAQFDTWTTSILTDPSVDNVIGNASLVQTRFVSELMPWFPISSGSACSAVARDSRGELMNLISMPNFGSMNDWSWMTLHWNDISGGTLKVALDDAVHTMNPYNEDTQCGWQILGRSVTGLLAVNPDTLKDMPYIATEWSITPWVTIPELGIINGSVVKFYLRQDVTWQDGVPVTAYDCTNNLRLLRKYKPGKYSDIWTQLCYEEPNGPYEFDAFFYTTSLYLIDNVAEASLLSPKHIADAAEAKYGSILTGWDPAFNSYKALMGVDPPAEYPFMKQIVGCGPFVYDYFDRSSQTGRVVKYDNFFVNAPVISAVVGEWWIQGGLSPNQGWVWPWPTPHPELYTYKVLVQNVGAQANSSEGELIPVTVDVKVYEDNVLNRTETGIVLNPWNSTYLGPYTSSFMPGKHEIKVEVYESGNLIHTYIHTFVVTPRADITSYAGDIVDCEVDIKDIFRICKAYGSYPGSPKWDPPCDVNDDFKVDIKDVFSCCKKYGWHA